MNKTLFAVLYACLIIVLLSVGCYCVLFLSPITSNIKPKITKGPSRLYEEQFEYQSEQETSQEDIQCEIDGKAWVDEENVKVGSNPVTGYDKQYNYLDSHYSPKLNACLVYYSNPLLTIKEGENAKITVFYGIQDVTNDKNLYFKASVEGISRVKNRLFSE